MMFSLTGITFFVFILFAITSAGYLLGRIDIKGISLGTSGVFIVALLFGCFFYSELSDSLVIAGASYLSQALKIVESLGLMFFVTSVGFIAGPSFVRNFKKNYKSYVLIGIVIIGTATIICILCGIHARSHSDLTSEEIAALMSGILSGALTSTPAFSSAKAMVSSEALETVVSVGYGIAYLFGVVGVVSFVQIMPKVLHVDMEKEREQIVSLDAADHAKTDYVDIDGFGFAPLAVAILVGIAVGSIKIGKFSLTTTGGCLLAGLLFGHFGHIGKISLMPKLNVLEIMRELGLVLFLIGAGIAGGARFVEYFDVSYFIYGVIVTTVPMVLGYFFADKVLKLSLLNNLGAITGGMTSTPALGTLISVAKTANVAAAYAATYPIALICAVLATQVVVLFFA